MPAQQAACLSLSDTGGHELNLQGGIGGLARGVYPDLFTPGSTSHGRESIAHTLKDVSGCDPRGARASPFPSFRGLPARLRLDFFY